jgi:hypothetical protein
MALGSGHYAQFNDDILLLRDCIPFDSLTSDPLLNPITGTREYVKSHTDLSATPWIFDRHGGIHGFFSFHGSIPGMHLPARERGPAHRSLLFDVCGDRDFRCWQNRRFSRKQGATPEEQSA